MAARIPLPNGSTMDIAVSLDDIVMTGLSNANPAVASAVANGLSVGDVVLIESGWAKVTGRAARVSAVTTDTATLGGINTLNTSSYPAGAGGGTLYGVESWVQISRITGVTTSGGEQQFLTVGYLEEDDDRQYPINKDPMNMQITVEDQPQAPYTAVVQDWNDTKEQTVVRLNLPNGDQILYPAYVSITETPTLERNALMTRTISVALSGRPIRYFAA